MSLATSDRPLKLRPSGLTELLLLVLVAGIAAAGADFTRIGVRIHGVTLYVTEAFLLWFCLWTVLRRKRFVIPVRGAIPLALYLSWGLMVLISSLPAGGMSTFRRFALVYYALFALVPVQFAGSPGFFERLFLSFSFGTAFSIARGYVNAITGTWAFPTVVGSNRYLAGTEGLYISVLLLAIIAFWPKTGRFLGSLAIGSALVVLGAIILVQHRSVMVALVPAAIVLFILQSAPFRRRYLRLAIWALVALVALVAVITVVPSGKHAITYALNSVKGITTFERDPNAAWRLLAWRASLSSVKDQPFTGVGLAVPLIFQSNAGLMTDVDPHNSLVQILLRLGLVGLFVFLWSALCYYLDLIGSIKRGAGALGRPVVAFLAAAHVLVLTFSLFNVVLETPYMGVFYWLLVGLAPAWVWQNELRAKEEQFVTSTQERVAFLVIGPTPPPLAGVEVMTETLLRGLRDRGTPVVHIDTRDPRTNSNKGRLDLANVYLAIRHGLEVGLALLRRKPAVVYLPISQTSLGYFRDSVFMTLATWSGSSLVVHLHGAAFDRFYASAGRGMKWLLRWTLRRVDVAVVLGQSLKGIFGELVSPERAVVVPNGIDGTPYHQSARNLHRPPTFLFMGTLIHWKGHRDVIEAMALVSREVPGARAVIAGSWISRKEEMLCRRMTLNLGLEDQIEFPGVLSGAAKIEAFKEADAFLLPSADEGQPVAILEALAAGLPVISTPIGAIPECVTDGFNGFLVKPGDIGTLGRKMIEAVTDADRWAWMSANATMVFQSRFSHVAYVDRLVEVLERARKRAGGGTRP